MSDDNATPDAEDQAGTSQSAANGVPASEGRTSGALPLFYTSPEALNPERHEKLGLDDSSDASFASATQAIPITLAEFPAICRTYPIVFVGRDNPQPVAIVGVRQQQNLFVGPDGSWKKGAYVPGYVRRYPYILVRETDGENFALCVDRASPRVKEGGAHPLFDAGKPSEATEKALEFCAAFQRQAAATEAFVARMRELELLIPNQAQFNLANGEMVRIADYFVLDERKLQELPDDAFLALRRDGFMAGIYCHLISTQVWGDLVNMAN